MFWTERNPKETQQTENKSDDILNKTADDNKFAQEVTRNMGHNIQGVRR